MEHRVGTNSMTNPYESPRFPNTAASEQTANRLTLFSATMYVVLTGGAGSLLGGTLGALMGTVAPDYYRAVFPHLNGPNFHPTAMGLALGAVQGLGGGIAVGFIILLIYVWYLTRAKRSLESRL